MIDNNEDIILKTPGYNKEFVDELKTAVPYNHRKWDTFHKIWAVSAEYAEVAAEIFRRHFETEEALEVEIEAIKANQAYVLENEEYINKVIEALDAAIGGYSFNSRSVIKGRMCRDRALLAHSLDNAHLSVERLVELQVRGLAAAVRLLENNSIAKLTARQ